MQIRSFFAVLVLAPLALAQSSYEDRLPKKSFATIPAPARAEVIAEIQNMYHAAADGRLVHRSEVPEEERTRVVRVGQHLGGGRYLVHEPDGVLVTGDPKMAEGDGLVGVLVRLDEVYSYKTVLGASRQVAVFRMRPSTYQAEPSEGQILAAIAKGQPLRATAPVEVPCRACKGTRTVQTKTGPKVYCPDCKGTGKGNESRMVLVTK